MVTGSCLLGLFHHDFGARSLVHERTTKRCAIEWSLRQYVVKA